MAKIGRPRKNPEAPIVPPKMPESLKAKELRAKEKLNSLVSKPNLLSEKPYGGRPTRREQRDKLRRIKAVQELLGEVRPGWDPLVTLAEIATDPEVEVATRARAAAEVASYLRPKLRAIEHKGEIKIPPVLRLSMLTGETPDAALFGAGGSEVIEGDGSVTRSEENED